jgi:hypothetical protein
MCVTCVSAGIVVAMELQAEAERRKRASILESEGQRQAVINVAEGSKQEVRKRDAVVMRIWQLYSSHLACVWPRCG